MTEEMQLREAKNTLSKLLSRAMTIRDSLNRNALSDEIYSEPRSIKEAQAKIDTVKRELGWVSREARI